MQMKAKLRIGILGKQFSAQLDATLAQKDSLKRREIASRYLPFVFLVLT
jgi:hypothetical protein